MKMRMRRDEGEEEGKKAKRREEKRVIRVLLQEK